jgi:hypothetical protein
LTLNDILGAFLEVIDYMSLKSSFIGQLGETALVFGWWKKLCAVSSGDSYKVASSTAGVLESRFGIAI